MRIIRKLSLKLSKHFLAIVTPSTTGCVISPVDEFPPNGPLEEAAATVTGEDAVVFSTAGVAANHAREAQTFDLGGRMRVGQWVRV